MRRSWRGKAVTDEVACRKAAIATPIYCQSTITAEMLRLCLSMTVDFTFCVLSLLPTVSLQTEWAGPFPTNVFFHFLFCCFYGNNLRQDEGIPPYEI